MSHRFSLQEFEQWINALHRDERAPRQAPPRSGIARGASDRTSEQNPGVTGSPGARTTDEWASERLFECYND